MEAVETAAMLGGEIRDEARDLVDHGVIDFARHRFAAVALRERDDADRHRCPADNVGRRRAAPAGDPERLSRTSSDEPPPMSNRMTPEAAGSNSSVQPVAASRASVAELMISSSRPASLATRLRNSSPFSAARQASVAMSRARMTPRACILSRQICSASTARVMAASLMRRDAAIPSPRRMIRENASTTRKPSPVGRATRSRQLLVPRSSAA